MKQEETNNLQIHIIKEENGEFVIENYHCQVCTSFLFSATTLRLFENHMQAVHKLEFKSYVETFKVETIHSLEHNNDDVNFAGVLFKKLNLNEEKNLNEEQNFEKKKPFLKINGEIVKRINIFGIESYERKIEIKKKNKITKQPMKIGGLNQSMLPYIPAIDNSFILNEKFHKQMISLLSSVGFRSMLLSGDTRLGKTESVIQIAARMRQPVIRQKITGNTKVKDIFQDENFNNELKKLVKIDKGMLQAMEMGAWYLVDEISASSPTVTFIFFELLEKGYVIDFDGKRREPHPMFKIIFTDNRIGNPNYFRYHGTFEQNAAFLYRIKSVITFSNLKMSTESKILSMRYPDCDEDFISKLMNITKLLREENKKGSFQEMLPIGTLENICSNYEVFHNAEDAFYLGYINMIADETDKEMVKGLCQRIFGNGMFQ